MTCQQRIETWLEEHGPEFAACADTIHGMAELSGEEHRSATVLEDLLERHGFTVERGLKDQPTAFRAVYGNGPVRIGFMCEYDALAGLQQDDVPCQQGNGTPGHGCGHNLLGAGSAAVISRSGEDNYHNLARHQDAELIVNATPVGMYPGNGLAAVDLAAFPNCQGAVDLIYNPARTRLLLQAEERGLCRANGLGMLVAQAKAAAERFLDAPIPDGQVEEITAQMERETQNLLLIGMPGCGKTTVGRVLAQRLGRTLVDTDALVVQAAGCPIPELFAREGEEAFRALEHQALCQAGRASGTVIATGGGIVTRRENWAPMRENSTVIFLRRPLDQLPLDGRPVSQANPLEELYEKRLPLYEKAADLTVDNDQVDRAVDEIIRRLKL